MKNNIEIMSPVGSYESLMGAIQAGANAIYFGIGQLNMRAKSSVNFTKDDLKKIISICKEHQIKSYLTVNTVLFDDELSMMKEIIDLAKENGISAVIASDISVIQYLSSKNIPVHISTQVNVTNIEAVKFYAKFADVMVLARELNLEQVKFIAESIKKENITGPSGNLIKIELFVHGALCMAVSGKCYLSLHEYNFSANRGKCLQTCRKSYVLTEKETGNELEVDNEYIMSPKDLSTIGFLNKILDAGVNILKIEGRARPAEYVKLVTSCYKEAIKSIENNTYTKEKIENWKEELSTVFNRGFWNGYYLGQKLGEWSNEYGSKATTRKQYIGKGQNYFSKIKVAEFLLQAGSLSVGDEILITGPTTGVIKIRVKEIRVDLIAVQTAKKGETISIPIEYIVRRSDKLYKVIKLN